ncbi:hypothetical protein BZA77DRAFT_128768 [Pyronema omphalodes]|nr:hypothetical protein BZA77DRAFT_128768 [Pyronema omphalodes]
MVMDPLSIAASVSGFLSLSIELSKILGAYISAAKSAPKEASDMMTEVSSLCQVLDILVDTLDSDDCEFSVFENDSVLCTIIRECQTLVVGLHKKLSKKTQEGKQGRQSRFRSVDKIMEVMEQFKWPFQKEECQERVQTLHKYVQTLQVLLISSNRSLLTQKASVIIGELEKQYQTVLRLMSDLANTGDVVDKIASDVGEVRNILKGILTRLSLRLVRDD